jgi:hypothetical protein
MLALCPCNIAADYFVFPGGALFAAACNAWAGLSRVSAVDVVTRIIPSSELQYISCV